MAGLSWFELDVDMPDDPKCVGLGARLADPLAFGYAVRLYSYCYRHGTDRFSGPGAPVTIENACGWRGKPGRLLAALTAEAFVDPGEGDTLIVHGVESRLVPHLAKREADRERARASRDAAAQSIERRANVARTSRGCSANVSGNQTETEQNKDLSDQSEGQNEASATLSSGLPSSPSRIPEFNRKLGAALARTGPRPFGLAAKDRQREVATAIEAALEAHGLDPLVERCAEAARSAGLVPRTLAWFVDCVFPTLNEASPEPAPGPRYRRVSPGLEIED